MTTGNAWATIREIQRATLAARKATGLQIVTRTGKGRVEIGYWLTAKPKASDWVALSDALPPDRALAVLWEMAAT